MSKKSFVTSKITMPLLLKSASDKEQAKAESAKVYDVVKTDLKLELLAEFIRREYYKDLLELDVARCQHCGLKLYEHALDTGYVPYFMDLCMRCGNVEKLPEYRIYSQNKKSTKKYEYAFKVLRVKAALDAVSTQAIYDI